MTLFYSLSPSSLDQRPIHLCTMVESRKKHRQNSHPIIHCPTSKGVSERVNEWVSERSGGLERSEQSQASEQVSGASERTSERPSTLVCIFGCSGPQCLVPVVCFYVTKSQLGVKWRHLWSNRVRENQTRFCIQILHTDGERMLDRGTWTRGRSWHKGKRVSWIKSNWWNQIAGISRTA